MPNSLKNFKDKKKAQIYRTRQRRNNYASSRPLKEYRFWSIQELEMLLIFKGTDRELGKIISRSVQAIQLKRVKINKDK